VAVTLSLLLVAKKMARHRVLVKELSTIETLSCVNVIASDKTGTLTQNKMFVSNILTGKIETQKSPHYDEKNAAFNQLVAVAGLCNDAHFIEDESFTNLMMQTKRKLSKKNSIAPVHEEIKGDATDIALLKFSTDYIHEIDHFRHNYTLLTEIPFNSKNKWMMKALQIKNLSAHNAAFDENATDQSCLMLLKGAPDKLLRKCNKILQSDGTEAELNDESKLSIISVQNEWCMLGQRVLLLCKKSLNTQDIRDICIKSQCDVETYVEESNDFCLVGLVGIIDPPRENMKDVIAKCRTAGIRVFMVTGDYSLTAAAIAKDIGIISTLEIVDSLDRLREKEKLMSLNNANSKKKKAIYKNALVLNGSDIDLLTDYDWRVITKYQEIVFARTTPEQKLKIVNEFQHDGYVVGVTGDGVNDAPALKKADIGIAMGSGSEVAMEASQMVLLDNCFSSILIAIENGRLVFDNLRKVIIYLLSAGCMGEVILLIFLTLFLSHHCIFALSNFFMCLPS
jgi:sodium/potassium-transporting ATPase subunit alpha